MSRRMWLAALAAFAVAFAWSARETYSRAETGVPAVRAVDHVTVMIAAEPFVKVRQIHDPAQVERIRAFVNARRTGWRPTWHTSSAPRVVVDLFHREKLVRSFGADRDFMASWHPHAFVFRGATPEEVAEFHRLIEVPQPPR